MSELKARDIMTQNVITITPDAELRAAAELMATHNISGLPVVDAAGTLVGILSEADILNTHRRHAAIPRLSLFGVYLLPEEKLMETYQQGMALTVDRLMSRNMVTAEEDTDLEELNRRMQGHDVNRLPIVRGRQLVGIVTRTDLLRGLLKTLPEAQPEPH